MQPRPAVPRSRALPIYRVRLDDSPDAHAVPCPLTRGELSSLATCRHCSNCQHLSTPRREADWLLVCGYEAH
jgi:hypothetical protein